MEDNSFTPSPAPTPGIGTNMPEFNSAPADPWAPTIPAASSMPDFGMSQAQPVAQPMPEPMAQPVPEPVAQPIAQPMPTPTLEPVSEPAPMPIQPVEPMQPMEPVQSMDPLSAQMEQIVEPMQPSMQPMAPDAFQPQEMPSYQAPAQTVEQLVAEAARQQAMNPTPYPVEKKKPNKIVVLLLGIVVIALGIVVLIFMLNQPNPQSSNPNDAPSPSYVSPDTSTPISELTFDKASKFLVQTAKYKNFFPDDYAEEDDLLSLSVNENNIMFYSYEKKSELLSALKTSPITIAYRNDMTSKNVAITQKSTYATVALDADALSCGEYCYGLIFDKKTINFYNSPTIDPATNTQVNLDHIMLVTHEKEDIERYAPLIAAVFMNGKKIYSTEIKTDVNYTNFLVHSIEYTDAAKKDGIKRVITHFLIDNKTGEMYYRPDLTENVTIINDIEDDNSEPVL